MLLSRNVEARRFAAGSVSAEGNVPASASPAAPLSEAQREFY